MRKHKPTKYQTKKRFSDSRSRVNVYLPNTESTSDNVCIFDKIEQHAPRRWQNDQVWEATEDCCEAKDYKFPRNKLDMSTLPLTPLCNTLKSLNVCSPQGANESKYSVSSANIDNVEYEVTESDLFAFSANMATISPGCKRQILRSKWTETSKDLDVSSQSRTLPDDKQQIHHSKNDLAAGTNNNPTTGSLPCLQKPRQEERNSSRNRQICKGKKQDSRSLYDSQLGIVSGKKLANSIAPEFHNLRHFLPLLTLCQCPDYDSAVIEVVRDYNDPCRGVASEINSPYWLNSFLEQSTSIVHK